MKQILLVILLFILPFSLFSQKKNGTKIIERLVYNGYYNLGFIWIKGGYCTLETTRSDLYPNSNKMTMIAKTGNAGDLVFKLRDTLISHYDKDILKTYKFQRNAHEGSYDKTFDYDFDYEKNVSICNVHKYNKYRAKDTIELVPKFYDMMTLVRFLRTLDYTKLKKGEVIPIKAIIDREIHKLYIRYRGRDTQRVKGVKYRCFLFTPVLLKGSVFRGGEDMKIWISDDENKLPIMVEAKVLVGSLKGELQLSKSIY